MYKVGDLVVNKNNICRIEDILHNYIKNEDYYLLIPIDDKSLKLKVPINSSIRSLISKEDIEKLIIRIPNIDPLSLDERSIENEYKKLYLSGKHEDLIKIIKTTYLRNNERIKNK